MKKNFCGGSQKLSAVFVVALFAVCGGCSDFTAVGVAGGRQWVGPGSDRGRKSIRIVDHLNPGGIWFQSRSMALRGRQSERVLPLMERLPRR